jgi:hypothetical protein
LTDFGGAEGLTDFGGAEGLTDFGGAEGLTDFGGAEGLTDFLGRGVGSEDRPRLCMSLTPLPGGELWVGRRWAEGGSDRSPVCKDLPIGRGCGREAVGVCGCSACLVVAGGMGWSLCTVVAGGRV